MVDYVSLTAWAACGLSGFVRGWAKEDRKPSDPFGLWTTSLWTTSWGLPLINALWFALGLWGAWITAGSAPTLPTAAVIVAGTFALGHWCGRKVGQVGQLKRMRDNPELLRAHDDLPAVNNLTKPWSPLGSLKAFFKVLLVLVGLYILSWIVKLTAPGSF